MYEKSPRNFQCIVLTSSVLILTSSSSSLVLFLVIFCKPPNRWIGFSSRLQCTGTIRCGPFDTQAGGYGFSFSAN